jgi:hypothetical protein
MDGLQGEKFSEPKPAELALVFWGAAGKTDQ